MIDGTIVPMIFAIMGTIVPRGSYSLLYSLCLVFQNNGRGPRLEARLNDRRLVLSPSYGEDAAAFLRSITFPAEELPLFTVAPPLVDSGGSGRPTSCPWRNTGARPGRRLAVMPVQAG
jgi:hypothetical protein